MNSNADLLKSLKIDRNAAPPPESRKGLWIGLADRKSTRLNSSHRL